MKKKTGVKQIAKPHSILSEMFGSEGITFPESFISPCACTCFCQQRASVLPGCTFVRGNCKLEKSAQIIQQKCKHDKALLHPQSSFLPAVRLAQEREKDTAMEMRLGIADNGAMVKRQSKSTTLKKCYPVAVGCVSTFCCRCRLNFGHAPYERNGTEIQVQRRAQHLSSSNLCPPGGGRGDK